MEFLENILGKVEVFNNLWPFVTYHNAIVEGRQTLKRNLKTLCSLEDDINKTLEVAEFHSGKKRKREVENWLGSVQRKKNDVQVMEQQIGDRKYSLAPWWKTRLQKEIREVEELCEQGKFDSLLLDVNETSGVELLTTKLVGQNSNEVLGRIWACLMNEQVLRIGVSGVEGVGKTEIMVHIYNQLLQDETFDHVYLVALSGDFSIHKLQSDIASEVGLDLFDEEDTRKRAAKLHKGLVRRNKCVLILDGLSSYFDQEEIGIPIQVGRCKLIISTRSLRLCQRMGCQQPIEIEPLPFREAEILFKKNIGLANFFTPSVEQIAKQIVKECGGLPGKIIGTAERMRGVNDITEWRYMLNELSACRGSFSV
ncbi:hypothetical protein P3X46_027045 [Hevea brasiliensis]|uniref:Uncharacterized protein n=2 Tax=Hevea brasiliensis TaxID=3981 RepID=A0ABQ9L231_HEVBR|nr:disease resistance protein RFL1 [Hevea brasiliensis]XP_021651915.2 disease resistance protein RFL1 [Hevea brasiliensis]KAF2314292.1 hypothetical protein GH714_025114 [Hevea brasiliensis]KAJ9153623.1 hypothetical protein P3X46_027045 [Hevea brasiliensis]KAJ9153624.1 hypothetical protein P3X46_027045 [Hevea brasiliensis]